MADIPMGEYSFYTPDYGTIIGTNSCDQSNYTTFAWIIPVDGYMAYSLNNAGSGGDVQIKINGNPVVTAQANNYFRGLQGLLPVKSGNVITVNYTTGAQGTTNFALFGLA